MATLLVLFVWLIVICFIFGFIWGWLIFIRENYLQCLFWFLVVCFTCPGFVSCRMDDVQDAPGQHGGDVSASDLNPD